MSKLNMRISCEQTKLLKSMQTLIKLIGVETTRLCERVVLCLLQKVDKTTLSH